MSYPQSVNCPSHHLAHLEKFRVCRHQHRSVLERSRDQSKSRSNWPNLLRRLYPRKWRLRKKKLTKDDSSAAVW